MSRYLVEYMESERGWGQDYWSVEYATHEEAKKAFYDTNKWLYDAKSTPDIYTMALKIVEIPD